MFCYTWQNKMLNASFFRVDKENVLIHYRLIGFIVPEFECLYERRRAWKD